MGHESAGEVIAVGELVTTHKVGDRVAGESQRVRFESGSRSQLDRWDQHSARRVDLKRGVASDSTHTTGPAGVTEAADVADTADTADTFQSSRDSLVDGASTARTGA